MLSLLRCRHAPVTRSGSGCAHAQTMLYEVRLQGCRPAANRLPACPSPSTLQAHLSVAMPRVMSRMTWRAFFRLKWIWSRSSTTRSSCLVWSCSVSAVLVPTCSVATVLVGQVAWQCCCT